MRPSASHGSANLIDSRGFNVRSSVQLQIATVLRVVERPTPVNFNSVHQQQQTTHTCLRLPATNPPATHLLYCHYTTFSIGSMTPKHQGKHPTNLQLH